MTAYSDSEKERGKLLDIRYGLNYTNCSKLKKCMNHRPNTKGILTMTLQQLKPRVLLQAKFVNNKLRDTAKV